MAPLRTLESEPWPVYSIFSVDDFRPKARLSHWPPPSPTSCLLSKERGGSDRPVKGSYLMDGKLGNRARSRTCGLLCISLILQFEQHVN